MSNLAAWSGALALCGAQLSSNMQPVLDGYRASQDVPGISAVVVRHGDKVFAGGSGLADIEKATPMTADTVLYIGSVSKVMTAILTLHLVEAGLLSLNDAAGEIATSTSATTPVVTVTNLLTHSSGLSREGNFGYWFTADFPDDKALRRYLANTPLRSAPGTSVRYSNIGYAALGLLIEKTTQQEYDDSLHARVLAPLQMKNSGARGPATEIAIGYTPAGRIVPSPARPFAGVGKRVGKRHVRTYHDARAMSPAFGAYSTANDMGRLLRFLLGFGSDDVLSQTMRVRLYERQSRGRGLGLKISRLAGRNVARHDGWFAAHRTHLILDIENGIGVVVMANSDNAGPGAIAEALLEEALAMP